MKYKNECDCGRPTNGNRKCAGCVLNAEPDDKLCSSCAESWDLVCELNCDGENNINLATESIRK
jgi:hypothetical protein